MTDQSTTTSSTQPDTASQDSLLSQAREALNGAGKTLSGAVEDLVETARNHPVAAAAITAGTAAAVAGAAYGISKLREGGGSE